MIYKLLPRKSLSGFGQLLRYISSEKENLNGNQLVVTHNLRGKSLDEYEQEYLKNEAWRAPRKNRTYCYHAMISFSDKDVVSDDVIRSVMKKYFALRGNLIAYAGVHRSTSSVHIHVAESGCQYRKPKASRVSFEDLKEIKLSLESHIKQHHPEIKHSFCEHGGANNRPSDREFYSTKRGTSLKQEAISIVSDCLSKSKTQTDFINHLTDRDILHYERKQGELTGVEYRGRKFRFSTLGFTKDIDQLDHLQEQQHEIELLNQLQMLRLQHESIDKQR